MGRIFVWSGYRGEETARIVEPVTIARRITQIQEIIFLADRLILELQARGCQVFEVPNELSLSASIEWINRRCLPGDVALAIDTNSFSDPNLWGTSIFYITNNIERKKHAELMLLLLMHRLPQIPNQGTKPDIAAQMGSLSFCRQTLVPSLLMKIGFLTNSDDLDIRLDCHREIALGIADGLIAWSREVSGVEPNELEIELEIPSTYPLINIRLNDRDYPEVGIVVNGNAYLPIDLVDRLGIYLTESPSVRLVEYQGVVYTPAIELRQYNLSVVWNNANRALHLYSILPIDRTQIDRIMGYGNTSEKQLFEFLEVNNENAALDFSDLPKIYQQEASIEGVNYDIAFCQMCLETGFLGFAEDILLDENNFARLGAIGETRQFATFSSSRIGVRAQIQHLKAYASREPLVQELVDPRFHLVTRGVAPLVSGLSGRWSADLCYGDKIMAILRRLYESANLL